MLSSQLEKTHFVRNLKWWLPGLLLSLAGTADPGLRDRRLAGGPVHAGVAELLDGRNQRPALAGAGFVAQRELGGGDSADAVLTSVPGWLDCRRRGLPFPGRSVAGGGLGLRGRDERDLLSPDQGAHPPRPAGHGPHRGLQALPGGGRGGAAQPGQPAARRRRSSSSASCPMRWRSTANRSGRRSSTRSCRRPEPPRARAAATGRVSTPAATPGWTGRWAWPPSAAP